MSFVLYVAFYFYYVFTSLQILMVSEPLSLADYHSYLERRNKTSLDCVPVFSLIMHCVQHWLIIDKLVNKILGC